MKRFLSLLLSLLLLASLCACAGSENRTEITENTVEDIINGTFETPKNVILIIGDGMGPNDIEITEKYSSDCYPLGLILNKIPNNGFATTHSANNPVTDSAASATALATGVKTNNGLIGKDPAGNDLKNVTEIAREQGKKVGIITNDTIYGATPGAFSVHNESRYNAKELVADLLNFKPDVLIGANYDETKEFAEESDFLPFLCAKNLVEFDAALASDPKGTKPFLGFIESPEMTPSEELAKSVSFALDRLKNEKGFFLMIESAGTDFYGHGNQIQGKMAGVVTLDRTVAAVLQFMQDNPDTLLIVTSDHETGGVQLPKNNETPTDQLFTTTDHTATPVRVFALGKGSEYFKNRTVDNTEIARFLIDAVTE